MDANPAPTATPTATSTGTRRYHRSTPAPPKRTCGTVLTQASGAATDLLLTPQKRTYTTAATEASAAPPPIETCATIFWERAEGETL